MRMVTSWLHNSTSSDVHICELQSLKLQQHELYAVACGQHPFDDIIYSHTCSFKSTVVIYAPDFENLLLLRAFHERDESF